MRAAAAFFGVALFVLVLATTTPVLSAAFTPAAATAPTVAFAAMTTTVAAMLTTASATSRFRLVFSLGATASRVCLILCVILIRTRAVGLIRTAALRVTRILCASAFRRAGFLFLGTSAFRGAGFFSAGALTFGISTPAFSAGVLIA
ncbi:MAG: hypothetical protein Q4P05_00325 [Actinomycetaceae bacterium]|nr:hypothetical protein [Actinomycetaceae bacterium]